MGWSVDMKVYIEISQCCQCPEFISTRTQDFCSEMSSVCIQQEYRELDYLWNVPVWCPKRMK